MASNVPSEAIPLERDEVGLLLASLNQSRKEETDAKAEFDALQTGGELAKGEHLIALAKL